ncbi:MULTISPECIES: response regulator [Brevibacillus]|jgi:two-component system response regulator YcbB|uniref:Transcriptional regulator n=1 Tax=Brevibacillus aydinogluensis TaxID=927786 RepID=A0AA48RDK0_9BACL|nr:MULTISPECIES: response regulator [Brevibacillus]REK66782.1 MAG: transcriptional regulator [Brevibacillus sp.]MBR8659989.1 response regulator [Brevibacillus sp. NL20B1]MDT3417480.1 two-component system response regulator YcbB [Brevibacillus aydinogluensis]NNV02270.1 response regulator [Brevibacillus sp. MCWH]CAJ1004057.1 Transcriptional regulator [Brevibacillus aydinogluensis]
MRYFIVDDDPAIRSMLAHIIEDADLGEVAGEAEDGSLIDKNYLELKGVDILLIDLLMPNRDGIETVRHLSGFSGRVVMISQVESKDMIAEAYSQGIEYYITKPINRLEVISVLQKVRERILLQRSIEGIQRSLSVLTQGAGGERKEQPVPDRTIRTAGKFLLTELGMIGESGSKDLLDMLDYLYRMEKEEAGDYKFPALKDIFASVAAEKLGWQAAAADVQKEVKAAEQRVRRAIYQALTHLASLGLTDYAHPKFESYATTFFDFTEVRKRMKELETHIEPAPSSIRINAKKFILVLYLEAKRLIG